MSGTGSLYLHIPFCVSKCPYCAFSSSPGLDSLHERYVRCLIREIDHRYPPLHGYNLNTLFIGGGTPTVLKSKLLVKIVEHCDKKFGFAADAEISIEANPGTVELDTLSSLAGCGINRLSLGVQSFSAKGLKALGRIYTTRDIYRGFDSARKAGFANINLDLMYGIPGQDIAAWRICLEDALRLGPEHLSLYQLSIDENTRFHELHQKGVLVLPEEEIIAEMDELMWAMCESAGYGRYEISNYAKSGHQCRHNLIYWKNEEYMACGSGAVSYCGGRRAKNIEDPAVYCERIDSGQEVVQESEELGREETFRETVMLGLRLIEGVSVGCLEGRFGLALKSVYGEVLDDLLDQGFLVLSKDYLRLTKTGRQLANQVMARLI